MTVDFKENTSVAKDSIYGVAIEMLSQAYSDYIKVECRTIRSILDDLELQIERSDINPQTMVLMIERLLEHLEKFMAVIGLVKFKILQTIDNEYERVSDDT